MTRRISTVDRNLIRDLVAKYSKHQISDEVLKIKDLEKGKAGHPPTEILNKHGMYVAVEIARIREHGLKPHTVKRASEIVSKTLKVSCPGLRKGTSQVRIRALHRAGERAKDESELVAKMDAKMKQFVEAHLESHPGSVVVPLLWTRKPKA